MKKLLLVAAAIMMPFLTWSQSRDSVMISNIFTFCLEKGKSYEWLEYLSFRIGHRLSGSSGAEKAVKWSKSEMEKQQYANVYLQEVMVPHWVRNNIETMFMFSGKSRSPLNICSLGGSIPTPKSGIRAKVVEVSGFDDLERLGRENIEGKIVFYNTPMKQRYYHTFEAYGDVGKHRWAGASNAAKYGAVASVTRSMTLALDDYPHTGAMGYSDSIEKIPACAISTLGAEKLSREIKSNPNTELEIKMNCETFPDKLSYNVIAEIKGTDFPDEIVLLGAHLDSWDKGHGAHDDGAGCVQSMELLHVFRELNIKPKRTVRVVLFMNEENGMRGALKYAEEAKNRGEKHIAAIETDAGGFTPLGFATSCLDENKRVFMRQWRSLYRPYGILQWEDEGGGVDIGPLKAQGALLVGLRPDSQRYFDYHHADTDTFDKVNRRELHLGTAAVVSLAWLFSEYGVE